MECPDCGAEVEPEANRAAVEETLAHLDKMGRLETVDAARVQAARSMADALDRKPFNSQMWREYREALERLTVDDDDGASDDDLREWLSSALRNAPEA